MSKDELLSECGMLANVRQGELLLQELGTILDVDPSLLRPSDRFRELLNLDSRTLGSEAGAVLKKYGMNSIALFGEDILAMLTRYCEAEAWERIWRSLPERPHNDDAWIDVVMEFTICKFLRTFGSAVVLSNR